MKIEADTCKSSTSRMDVLAAWQIYVITLMVLGIYSLVSALV